jgi:hypothetical protein
MFSLLVPGDEGIKIGPILFRPGKLLEYQPGSMVIKPDPEI